MKTAILTKIALALALYLLCPGMSWAEAPEYDITVGRTIHTDKPVCLVYRHDGFWVTGGVTEGTLRHYSTDGTLLAEYQLPGSVSRYGVAWDGTHWWIADNNYGPETIYKCELNEAEKRLEPLRAYAWPHQGPSGLEWAQGYLWVSDHSTDIIYRVSVGDTSFTAIEAWFRRTRSLGILPGMERIYGPSPDQPVDLTPYTASVRYTNMMPPAKLLRYGTIPLRMTRPRGYTEDLARDWPLRAANCGTATMIETR